MSKRLEVVAVLYPKAGKADRVVELMAGVAKVVENTEPDTLKYQLLKTIRGDPPKVIVSETYKDEEAFKKHGKFPEFKEVNKALVKEQLLDGKTQIFVLSPAAGFSKL